MVVRLSAPGVKRRARTRAAARAALRCLVAAVAWLAPAGLAQAQPTTVLDGDLVVAPPAALPTGLSMGVGLGFLRGCTLAWGVRASWSTATEYTLAWQVDHDDVRIRAVGALQKAIGRGTLALRLGVGATLVHETRTRTQGARAGLTGNDLQITAWAGLPAADLEGVVMLHLSRSWSLIASVGPSLHLLTSGPRAGWTSSLGVAWQP